MARRAERRERLNIAPFAAYPAAAAVLRQSANSAPSYRRRLQSASALIADGAPTDATVGVQALVSASDKAWLATRKLRAVAQLVNAVGKRADADTFAQDVSQAQLNAAGVIDRWWRTESRGVRLAIEWPSALSEDKRRDLLTAASRSRRKSSRTAIAAAGHLAEQFNDSRSVELLEEIGKGGTRFRIVRSRDDVQVSSVFGSRLVRLVFDHYRHERGFLSILFGVMVALGSVVGLFAARQGERTTSTMLVVATTAAVVLTSIILPALLSWAGDRRFSFAPWWIQPTRAAELARAELYHLANNGSAEIQKQATLAIKRNGWESGRDRLPSLLTWIMRGYIREGARVLAVEIVSSREHPSQAIAELRQRLAISGHFDRRVIGDIIYEVAYGNPRGATRLLPLLIDQPKVNRRLRQRAEELLDVLDAEDF